MNRSVFAHRIAFSSDPEKTLQRAFDLLRKKENVAVDAKLVVISDVLANQPTEAIQIRRLH
jgi:pyruvate kinase